MLLRQSCDMFVVACSTGTPRARNCKHKRWDDGKWWDDGNTMIGAISACHLLLLWASLCCIHAKACANGCQRTALTYRSGRQLQAMTLVAAPHNSSGGGVTDSDSPPVNGTVYFEPAWAVLSLAVEVSGSSRLQEQSVMAPKHSVQSDSFLPME